MRFIGSFFLPTRRDSASALVITLIIITLMLFLLMAFFSQSTLQRGSANASASLAAKNIFSSGSIDMVVSDLEQEVSDGSNLTNVTAGAVTNVLFIPIARSTMMPALAGCTGGSGLENLVKRSAAAVPFYGGTNYYQSGIIRACASSSTNSSWNGRTISTTRWNKSLLLARANTNSASDVTPVASYVPPDWILISRSLSNPVAWNSSLRWSPTNPNTVIGRVAYQIFDEGGLLDANVAGYPSTTNALASASLTRKSGAACADLTQVGLTKNQINALTGWRNFVTGNAGGGYPSYTFSDGGVAYASSLLGVTNGFLLTSSTNTSGPNALGAPITDHKFVNRQELISFLSSADPANVPAALNALRYFTSYSRDLNQPSFAPNLARPSILAVTAGGNDSTGSDNQINPSFLSICVTTNFIRSDGTMASIGDPLVRKRFPLSYLSWLTYQGPSASAPASVISSYTNAGAPAGILQQGSAANIRNFFGLVWNNSSTTNSQGFWSYRLGTNQPINTLSQVAALGRDPDFFELLKAGLVAGSLGKAYAAPGSLNSTPDGYNQQKDNSLDAQVMQIGANIIAQSSPDGFCPRIQFNDGKLFGGIAMEYRGVKDLPYLYRVREGKVMTADSIPSVSQLPMKGGTLTNTGSGVVLLEPEVWNPHAQGVLPSNAPTVFQLVASTVNPVTLSPVSYTIGTQWITQSGANLSWQSNASTALNATLSFMIPSGRGDLFREPTLLTTPGIPSGSSLSGPGPFTSLFPAGQYASNGINGTNFQKFTGFPMGVVPMAFATNIPTGSIASNPPSPSSATNGILPSGYVWYPSGGTAGVTSPCVLISLQYQDTGGNWVTYDQKFLAAPNSSAGYGLPSTGTNTNSAVFQYNVNKTFYRDSNSAWSKNAIGSEVCAAAVDPRTSRFGMLRIGSAGASDPSSSFPLGASPGGYASNTCPLYAAGWSAPIGTAVASSAMTSAASQNAVLSDRPDELSGMLVASNSGPGAAGWYPTGVTARLRPGMLSQNNPNMTISVVDRFNNDPQNPPSSADQFFADPDGVIRRGMSANVPYGSGMPALQALGNNPSGLPTLPATFYGSGMGTPVVSGSAANEYLGRPVVLNRPFRSVSELGVVFSGTPWRNLDFTSPESGANPLLDLFCLNDTSDSRAMTAGRVNLNTRQIPVLKALLAGSYKDEFNLTNTLVNGTMSSTLANAVATALVARTHSSNDPAGPLQNLSDLAGSWNIPVTTSGWLNGSASYSGFSEDVTTSTTNDLTSVLASYGMDPEIRIERFREAAVRGLASSGQTRVWNLMIDLVVQTGRYPLQATSLNQFLVEGEQRLWVHLAIDRMTGQLVDKQIEVVNE
jgi:hypothetical protein